MSELQNDKCLACRFCSWYEEYQEYKCDIKGCYENSKFIEYKCIFDKKREIWI